MDPEIRELVVVVKDLVQKVDGLLCHFTSIDADYCRVRDIISDHEHRIAKLENHPSYEPGERVGEKSSLMPSIKR